MRFRHYYVDFEWLFNNYQVMINTPSMPITSLEDASNFDYLDEVYSSRISISIFNFDENGEVDVNAIVPIRPENYSDFRANHEGRFSRVTYQQFVGACIMYHSLMRREENGVLK